jgi:hypothetical protein
MTRWNWGQPIDGVIQVAYVVEDIHRAMADFAKRLRIGPWFLFEHFQFAWLKYRGQPADLDITLALGNSGGMTFELIQQNDKKPSVYRDLIDRRGYGFHHWAIGSDSARYSADVERYRGEGYAIACEAQVAIGARAAYVDTLNELGGMTEIIEVTPAVEGLFTTIALANVGWDGSQPVRTLGG